MDMWGGEAGEGEMCGENNMEIYITICKADSPWEFAVCLREFKLGLCGWRWDGEGDRREVQVGGDMGVPVADTCWCVTENHKTL